MEFFYKGEGKGIVITVKEGTVCVNGGQVSRRLREGYFCLGRHPD